jgi:hypothetical protein
VRDRPRQRFSRMDAARGLDHYESPVEPVPRVLAHSLQLADRVAFIATVNHWWTKHRRALVRRAGFGIATIIEFDTPREWQATGFQLGMVLLVRGHDGPCTLERC